MKEIDHKSRRRSSSTFQVEQAGRAQEPSGLSLPERELPRNLLDMPIIELAKLCVDPAILLAALGIAYQQGYKLASEKCHRFYHMMLTRQDEEIIKN